MDIKNLNYQDYIYMSDIEHYLCASEQVSASRNNAFYSAAGNQVNYEYNQNDNQYRKDYF
ncbi:hypothetical protein SAMN05216436_10613 [bacterium A37T11]|nr:hypothetical protein SAMN05216436_10613 [bacterium A37T11]